LLRQKHAENRIKTLADFSFSQEYFEKVGDEEAIPFNLITAMAQDRQGFLWIGSQGGLVRYDGYRFQKYVNRVNDPTSLPSDYVKSLLATSDGKICVGSISEGLACLNPKTEEFTQFRHDKTNPESISSGVIFGMAEDHHGGIWVIGDNTGLDYLVPNTQKFLHFRHQPDQPLSLLDNRVHSAIVDRHGTLWVGMHGGLQNYPTAVMNFETVASDPGDPNSLSKFDVRTIFEASDGKSG